MSKQRKSYTAEFSRQTGVVLCDNSFPKVPLPSDN